MIEYEDGQVRFDTALARLLESAELGHCFHMEFGLEYYIKGKYFKEKHYELLMRHSQSWIARIFIRSQHFSFDLYNKYYYDESINPELKADMINKLSHL